MSAKLRPYTKALIALFGGAVAQIIVALEVLPPDATLGDISQKSWFIIVAAWLALAGGVFEGNNEPLG